MSDIESKRPLSPHLTIYKPPVTMVVSIIHRITGAGLYFGILLIAWWLVAAASGEVYFNYATAFMNSIFGHLILFGFTWALIQHLLGGIKHLFWEMGYGFEKESSKKIAWATLAGSALLTIAIWLAGYAVN
ncbi:MAG: succinate dehydrogenase, cytochrome b556 subunit [Rhizobiaceae bacterium]|nr:succinate dehydrogenase, cytochrome b556 subunit [Rhizobiaceae bacterium]